jgi:hypothetical protein
MKEKISQAIFTKEKKKVMKYLPLLCIAAIILLVLSLIVWRQPEVKTPVSAKAVPRIVISLTSIPERLRSDYFKTAAHNLLSQDPNALLQINLPETYARTGETYTLPGWLKKHPRVRIVRMPTDLGPLSKIAGGLHALEPTDTVIVVDDDLMYKPFVVGTLTEHVQKFPEAVTCYSIWKDSFWVKRGHGYELPGGYSGCAGTGAQFQKLSQVHSPPACFSIDDHFLGWAYHKLDIPLRSVDSKLPWDVSIGPHDQHPVWYELQNTTNRAQQQKLCLDALL